MTAAALALPTAALLAGPPLVWEVPVLRGFNFSGGAVLSPEFAALLVGLVVNASATSSEIVRSGIQAVPAGQWEGARALGLPWHRTMRLVILPQALRTVIPSIVTLAIGILHDTTLVIVIGLSDVLNTARSSASDPQWIGYFDEAFAFAAVLYLVLCVLASRYSLWLEARLARPR